MGFFDNAGNLLNRGVATAGRGTKAISLKAHIADLGRTRSGLMSQLGESLYDITRESGEFRTSRESLYSSIEGVDARVAALRAELDMIESQSRIVTEGVASARCPSCGRGLSEDDAYCPGCGVHVDDLLYRCSSCGALVGESDAFCMTCGAAVTFSGAAEASESQLDPDRREVSVSCFDHALESEAESEACSESEDMPEPEAGCELEAELEIAPESESEVISEPRVESVADPTFDDIRVCPACGYRASISATFCRECGLRL